MRGTDTLKILQYNVHTDRATMITLLAEPRTQDYDIVINIPIQKPWRNLFVHQSVFHLLHRSGGDPRVCE